jgi:outer membrane protein TolC
MKTVAFVTVVLSLALSVVPLSSEELTLDAETSVKLALQNNLSVKGARIDLTTKRRSSDTAWNALMPSLSAGTTLSHTKSYSESNSTSQAGSPWDLSFSIRTNLPLSASTVYSIRDALLSYETGVISLEETEKQLKRDVKKSFSGLLLKQENIRLIEQNIETALYNYELAVKKYERGLVPELEMLSAQVELESLKPDLEDAKVDYETALMDFKQILGLDQRTEVVLKGSIEIGDLSLDAEALIDEHISKRFDVRSRVKDIHILENQKQLVTAQEFEPVLSLSYSFGSGLNDPFDTQWSDIDNWSRRGSFEISMTLPLDPWFPASSSRVKRQEKEDSLSKARIELVQTRQLAEIEIRSLVMKLVKSQRTMEALEKNVELAQKVYDLRETEYRTGLAEFLEVKQALDDLQKAKLNVLTEKYNYQVALLDLEYALNTQMDSDSA